MKRVLRKNIQSNGLKGKENLLGSGPIIRSMKNENT